MGFRKRFICLILTLVLGICLVSCTRSPEEAERKKIDSIIADMTLEEKATLVVGTGMNMPGGK